MASQHLARASVLSDGIMASVPPMVDSLSTADYHQIRENLGLTSGSHSVTLRYHLFTNLYEELWEALGAHLTGRAPGEAEPDAVIHAVEASDAVAARDGQAQLLQLIVGQCLALRAFVLQWRDQHLHLPRNNLGGSYTRSLTGSPDAVKAVERMRDTARHRDPLQPLAQARGVDGEADPERGGRLASYLHSEASLDSAILEATGRATQQRFRDVQERLGYFATRSQFTPPPKREA
jgi:hypothetical protein